MNNGERINLFNGFTLDLARGCVVRAGEPVHLRPQCYEVLRYLVENKARLISKDKLIEEVWKGRAVTDDSLAKCIKELREALGPNAQQFVRNVRGRGYIFDTGVEERETPDRFLESEQIDVVRVTVEDYQETDEINSTALSKLPHAVEPSRSRIHSTKAVAATTLLIITIIAVIVGYRSFTNRASSLAPIKSIAVSLFRTRAAAQTRNIFPMVSLRR